MKAKKSFVFFIFGLGFLGGGALGLLAPKDVGELSGPREVQTVKQRRSQGTWTARRIALSTLTRRRAPRIAARDEKGRFKKIRGRVTNRQGRAISGALVEVQLPPSVLLDRGSPPEKSGKGSYVRQFLQLKGSDSTALSDKNGLFEIPRFTESMDRIVLSKAGYLFQRLQAEENGDGVQVQFIAYPLSELSGSGSGEEDNEEEGNSSVQFQVYDPEGRLLNSAQVSWESEENSGELDWTQENNSVTIPPGRYKIFARADLDDVEILSEKQNLVIQDGAAVSLSFTVNQFNEDSDDCALFVRFNGLKIIPPENEDEDPEVQEVYYALVPYLGANPSDEFLARRFRSNTRSADRDIGINYLNTGNYMLLCGRGRGSFEFKKAIVISKRLTVVEVQLPKETESQLTIRAYGPDGEAVKDLSVEFELIRYRWNDDFNLPLQFNDDGSLGVQVPYFAPSKELAKNEDKISVYSDKYGRLEQIYQPGQSEMTFQFQKKKTLSLAISGYRNCGVVGKVRVYCGGESLTFEAGSEDSQTLEIDSGQDESHNLEIQVFNQEFERRSIHSKKIMLSDLKNRADVVIPKLYPLTIQCSLDSETRVDLQPLGALEDTVEGYGLNAKVNSKGLVQFINLPAGQYKIEVDDLTMVATVPSPNTVVFEPKVNNSLEIKITNSRGYLSAQGFRNRDIIVGVSGKRYPNTDLEEVINEIDGTATFLVDRQGRTVEIVADPQKLLRLESHLGGKLRERQH